MKWKIHTRTDIQRMVRAICTNRNWVGRFTSGRYFFLYHNESARSFFLSAHKHKKAQNEMFEWIAVLLYDHRQMSSKYSISFWTCVEIHFYEFRPPIEEDRLRNAIIIWKSAYLRCTILRIEFSAHGNDITHKMYDLEY